MTVGVIYIGDRSTGKTSLVLELANPKSIYVKVIYPDYETLRKLLFLEEEGVTRPTDSDQSIYDRPLQIEVGLPTKKEQINLDWQDTPGEIWRSSWQAKNKPQWDTFLQTILRSNGIMLVVPPYREIIKAGVADPDEFITQEQWCNRFNRWVDFFRHECPKVKHLAICLNKADLFCDLNKEAAQLAYTPHSSKLNWMQRHEYLSQRYFRPLKSQIEQINKSVPGLTVRCFITSIHNRQLLELPWIYLGSYLAK